MESLGTYYTPTFPTSHTHTHSREKRTKKKFIPATTPREESHNESRKRGKKGTKVNAQIGYATKNKQNLPYGVSDANPYESQLQFISHILKRMQADSILPTHLLI